MTTNIFGSFPPDAGRTMYFIDGENLVFRFQDMLKAGRKQLAGPVTHILDIFIWNCQICASERGPVRVNYYTSACGDDDKINQLRDQIGKHLIARAGHGRRLHPHVFKKLKASTKSKLVDITLTIDALRHAYGNHVDTIYLYSGDGDYIPLVKEIMRNGKQVVIGALSSGLSPEMRRIGDQFIDLDPWFFQPASPS